MYLPSERDLYFFNQQQDRKRKLILNAGRRSGKSIQTFLSIVKNICLKNSIKKWLKILKQNLNLWVKEKK